MFNFLRKNKPIKTKMESRSEALIAIAELINNNQMNVEAIVKQLSEKQKQNSSFQEETNRILVEMIFQNIVDNTKIQTTGEQKTNFNYH